MATYTTELRSICENYAGRTEGAGYADEDNVIETARKKIFDWNYELFDNSYKPVIETKIIRHYYTREIGFETVGLWHSKLKTRFNEVLPYYNKLYLSDPDFNEAIKYNPLYDTDITTDHVKGNEKQENYTKGFDENIKGTKDYTKDDTIHEVNDRDIDTTESKSLDITDNTIEEINKKENETKDTTGTLNKQVEGTSHEVTHSKDRYSDTPQGAITDLEADKYLTNARIIDGTDDITTHETTDQKTTENVVDKTTTDTIDETDYTREQSESKTLHTDDKNVRDETDNTKYDEDTTKDTTNTTVYDDHIGSTEDYLQHIVGKRSNSSYSKYINEWRDTFLNIDLMFVKEFSNLFMNIW